MASALSVDDREEGEIVDDDFEDISDNSIIVPMYSGKSVSSKEHLPAISLSSVTEVEDQELKCAAKTRRRHKSVRRRNSKLYKKRRSSHRKSTCSDSDSDDYVELDRKLQKQLKAAIRVDNVGERHKNSLRSRLRGMTKLDANNSDISVEQNEDNSHKIEQKVSSDEGDTELTQLRLEALRTAVLNKFMLRKKRKIKEVEDHDILSDFSIKTDTSETNKENTHNANENYSKKPCLDKLAENIENKVELTNNIENNTAPEEDEDVLRALLLASMSKKITDDANIKKTVLPTKSNNVIKQTAKQTVIKSFKTDTKNISLKNVNHFQNRVVKNNVVLAKNQPVQLPKVKPLIININGDSDTDDDSFNKSVKKTADKIVGLKKVDTEIENTVEKFLKEQRAKVEAQLSPVPKVPISAKNTSVILEKSSVKLLPKVKQIEYQKLLQRLKNAEKKPRIRRSSHKFSSDGKPIGYTSKKIVRSKVPVKQNNATLKIEQIPDIKVEARILHKTLKEMQVQKNGRLQIQEKYKVLTPVVKKINETSIERKKYDEEVKELLEKLSEVKNKLLKSHQNFTAHVKELIEGKEEIDKSLGKPEVVDVVATRFTSTPIKAKPLESFEGSCSSITVTTADRTRLENVTDKTVEQSVEIPKEEDVVDVPINPGDPNDIDKIYSKDKEIFPRYISPLDKVKRVAVDDPFSIICPYDVDGNCRDPECVYRHLFK